MNDKYEANVSEVFNDKSLSDHVDLSSVTQVYMDYGHEPDEDDKCDITNSTCSNLYPPNDDTDLAVSNHADESSPKNAGADALNEDASSKG